VNAELQRRAEAMKQSPTGTVLCELFAEKLETVKSALCIASEAQVPRLQGQAAAYLELINMFRKTRE
jgi:hypothetical protein